MKRMTVRQQEMLESFARDGEATDLDAFYTGNPLDWHNRERCIVSCHARGWLDDDGLTEAGWVALQLARVERQVQELVR
jgi:hypothetical protein